MEKMTNIEATCTFLGITKKTWYNWKKENRPITKFIEKYISNEEIVEFLKNEVTSNYEAFKTINEKLSSELSLFCYPTEHEIFTLTSPQKFYWDFIFRFNKEIAAIDYFEAKKSLMILLYEYQIILNDISKTINYSESKVFKSFYNFINYFNDKDDIFIIYFINSVKYNYIVKYLPENKTDSKIVNIPSYSKHLLNIDIEQIKYLNTFFSSTFLLTINSNTIDDEDRDFFEIYEKYLDKV